MNVSLHDHAGHAQLSNNEFLAYAFSSLRTDEKFWVTGFPGDPYSVEHWCWGGVGAPPGLPNCIQPAHNNYVAISSFKRGEDGLFHRRKANFSRLHMVMVDDVGTKVPFDRLALSPSARVETSPGNFQDWYFLTEPVEDAVMADRLIKGMIESGLTADASDPGMRGVTRYGRLPVGINGKVKYVEKLGHPFEQTVTVWEPLTRYSVDEIAKAYDVDLTVRVHRRPVVMSQSHHDASEMDGFIHILGQAGLYIDTLVGMTGGHRIICPWYYLHTDEDTSGTVYFSPGEENNWKGGFKCHHGHCQSRSIVDLAYFVGRLATYKENIHA